MAWQVCMGWYTVHWLFYLEASHLHDTIVVRTACSRRVQGHEYITFKAPVRNFLGTTGSVYFTIFNLEFPQNTEKLNYIYFIFHHIGKSPRSVCHWYPIFVDSIFDIIFVDILNISIFIIYWNVGLKHDTIKTWQYLTLRQWFCLDEQWCVFLDFVIYASKLITNQKWIFISYNLCDFYC